MELIERLTEKDKKYILKEIEKQTVREKIKDFAKKYPIKS